MLLFPAVVFSLPSFSDLRWRTGQKSILVKPYCLLLSKLKNVNIFIQISMFTLRSEKQQPCHKCSVWPLLIVFFERHWFSYRIFLCHQLFKLDSNSVSCNVFCCCFVFFQIYVPSTLISSHNRVSLEPQVLLVPQAPLVCPYVCYLFYLYINVVTE